MRKGINYDTGFLPRPDISREEFDRASVRSDLGVIAGELHCTDVRVSGGDADRLEIAAQEAAAAGLRVFLAPFPVDVEPAAMLELYADVAERAERLRRDGADLIVVTGCESSAFCPGFIEGDTYLDRLNTIGTADMAWWEGIGPIMGRFNAFLAEAAGTVRKRFGGPVTYASGPWEFVDWSPFDLVGVDAYRAAYNAGTFLDELRAHRAHGKPVVVTEFGTAAYTGAGLLGGMAWQPPADAVRDEDEQVRYLTELLAIFEAEGVDTALWFTFAGFHLPGDADLASYGVVRMLDGTRWEPKAAFHAMAALYAQK
ncbi:hypothetical protein OIE66_27775 [Nonomuraea sp. NBC_01738]|uniref:hypothetical protein n=1 Tax=Nonomuraea sp. NBC_01738 TaxID=2976003 RepID=UPI002E15B0AF|nr:hypothetical protein OIE66_27775 [Nonomuraea sp. NBC_01738]